MGHGHHHHGHGHSHGHGHHHPELESASDTPLVIAVVINVLLTVVELVAGVLSGSLALIADGLHNLADAGSLVVALVGRRISKKPADERRTFGYRRADVVGALINLVLLVVLAGFLTLEGVQRLLMPQEIIALPIMIVAGVALLVDLASAWLVARLAGASMGTRVAMIHKIADAAGSVGVIFAGLLVYLYEVYWIDTLVAFGIAFYMAWQARAMIGETTGILMQGVPPELDINAIAADLRTVVGVEDVHHLHVWRLDEQTILLEAHVVCARERLADIEPIKHAIRERLQDEWGIGHTTLEFEHVQTAQREAAEDADMGRLVPKH
ncbi:MAG: cation diffusion facilitator family transporter [Planctomycetota bacterium]